jgi:hypothetical protein
LAVGPWPSALLVAVGDGGGDMDASRHADNPVSRDLTQAETWRTIDHDTHVEDQSLSPTS